MKLLMLVLFQLAIGSFAISKIRTISSMSRLAAQKACTTPAEVFSVNSSQNCPDHQKT